MCVDNSFVEPYNDVVEGGDDREIPKKLFESFRKENCSLNIYRYKDTSKWEQDREYVLNNHDLLILDWELVGEPPFQSSLEILWEAVNLQSLPFVLIYTQENDTSIIELNIRSFFGKPYADITERRKKYEEFCGKLEENTDISDPNRLFETIFKECKQQMLNYDRTFIQDSLRHIRDYCEKEEFNFNSFINSMKDISRSILNILEIEDILEFIVFHHSNSAVNNKGYSRQVSPIYGAKHSFLINSTTITIFVKPKASNPESENVISPDRVYKYFSESIYKPPRNFLALLSLEMKTLYRENAGMIGSELYNIDEIAFFHHQKSLSSEDEFYDFLRNCWKDQLYAFDFLQNPKLFSVLGDYKSKINYETEIEKYKQKEFIIKFQEELVKLNYQYSFLKIKRKENDKIRFGDLFLLSKNENGSEQNGFMLCITPHCDCLHTENIKNKFYFVFADKVALEEGLKSAEEGFYSFLIYKDKPLCLKWSKKPFTLYIPEDKANISQPIQVRYHDSDYYLIYKATQKENYTQRIANEAFSHASRIGIELAGIK